MQMQVNLGKNITWHTAGNNAACFVITYLYTQKGSYKSYENTQNSVQYKKDCYFIISLGHFNGKTKIGPFIEA